MSKCVIFDMDGLIFDTESVWMKGHHNANRGINMSEEFRISCCGKKSKEVVELLKQMFPDKDAVAIRQHMKDFVKDYAQKYGVELKHGFVELISFLKLKGVKTALATGSSLEKVKLYFGKAGLDYTALFDKIATIEEVSHGKPHPEIYNLAVKKLGAMPKDCYVLEDSINGILSAKAAGCRAIMVIDLVKPTTEIREICETVTNNLFEAMEFLKNKI